MEKQLNKKVPAIRFKGFEEGWIEQPIGKAFAEKKRPIVLVDDQEYELITVKRRNGGITSRGYLLGREILVKNYYQLKAGDFVVSKRQVVHGATGVVPETLNNAIVSNEYLVAEDGEQLTAEFMNLLSFLPDMKSNFFLSSYGVDIEKLFFDADDWKQRRVTTPDVTEQTKIAGYFKTLDKALTLHQHKHDKLVTLKQAMLQKMFPQKNEAVPKIRFKGFSGEWKKGRLADMGKFNPNSDLPNVFEYVDLESVVGTRMVNHRTEIKDLSPSRARRLARKGDVFFQAVRPYQKNNLVFSLDGDFVFSTGYIQIRPSGDSYFIFSLMQQECFIKVVLDNCTGTSYPVIKSTDLGRINIFIPSFEEQQKIGNYFEKLDQLISQHATQLEKLKQIKAACLERMFV